jgi:hypothetical protein
MFVGPHSANSCHAQFPGKQGLSTAKKPRLAQEPNDQFLATHHTHTAARDDLVTPPPQEELFFDELDDLNLAELEEMILQEAATNHLDISQGNYRFVASPSSTEQRDVKSRSTILLEKLALQNGLFTPERMPDTAAARRAYYNKLAKKQNLKDGEEYQRNVDKKRYATFTQEADQMGMGVETYKQFLTTESRKQNFPPGSHILRQKVQVLLTMAQKNQLAVGKKTEDFVKEGLLK